MDNKDFKPLTKISKEINDLRKSNRPLQKQSLKDEKYKLEIEKLRQENEVLKKAVEELKGKETTLLKDNEQLFKEYYKQGFEDCKKKYLLDLNKCLSNLEYILTEKDKIYKEKSEEVYKLIVSIVEEVMDKFLEKYKEQKSVNLVLKSLNDILDAQLLSDLEGKNAVYMNKEDLNNFENLLKEDQQIKDIIDNYNIKLLPSNNLDKGDLIIVTDDLYISARIKDKLKNLLDYLKENPI